MSWAASSDPPLLRNTVGDIDMKRQSGREHYGMAQCKMTAEWLSRRNRRRAPILTDGIKCQVLWRKLSTATFINLLFP
jgi:hypothetical protein